MPARFSLPIYALRQLKERLIPSKNVLTFTLTIEFGESVLAIHEGDKCLWSHKIPFAANESAFCVFAC